MKKTTLLALAISGVLPFAANAADPTHASHTFTANLTAHIDPTCEISSIPDTALTSTDTTNGLAPYAGEETISVSNCYTTAQPVVYLANSDNLALSTKDGGPAINFNVYTDSAYNTAMTTEGADSAIGAPISLSGATGQVTVYAKTADITSASIDQDYSGTVTYVVYY